MLRRRRVTAIVAVLVAALLLAGGAFLGQQAAYSGMGIDPQRYRALQRELPEAKTRISNLEQALSAAQTRHEVDRAALELVRKDLARQQEEIADLDEGLRFYRSLMAPGEIAQGFSLRDIEIVSRDVPGVFAYRIVAQQEARKHETMRGDLIVQVLGLSQGESVSYPLSALAGDKDDDGLALRFRYFQVVEGELTLPEGFEPQSVEVEAKLSSPRSIEVRESYPWRVQEKFTHVGK